VDRFTKVLMVIGAILVLMLVLVKEHLQTYSLRERLSVSGVHTADAFLNNPGDKPKLKDN
jgi:hypothetical protein